MPLPKAVKDSFLSFTGIVFIFALGFLAKEKNPVLGTIFGVARVNADAPAAGGGGGGGDESGIVLGDFGCCISSCDGDASGGGDGGAGGGDGGAGGGGGDACVIKGTKIAMGDGSQRPIELVNAGDIVWSVTKDGLKPDTVIERIQHDHQDHPLLILLSVEKEELILTSDHHVMTTRGWLRTDEVKIGETLYRFTNRELKEISVESIGYQYSREPLYTIRTSSDNYLASNLLIHTEVPYRIKSEAKPQRIVEASI